MSTFGRRLREARAAAKLTQDQLGDRCGVSRNAVSRWESDTDMPGMDKMGSIAKAVRESADYLLTGRGRRGGKADDSDSHLIPVVGTAQLGDEGHWLELEYPTGHGEGFVPYPSRDPNTYALRVKGDSMRPRIKPGEFVVIEPNHSVAAGEEVMVQTKDGRSMVKILGHKRGGLVELLSINENQKPISLEERDIVKMHYVGGIIKASLYYEKA